MTRKQLLNLPPYALKGFVDIYRTRYLDKDYFYNLIMGGEEIYSVDPIHSFVANTLLETFCLDTETTTVSEMTDRGYSISFETDIQQLMVQNNSGKSINSILIKDARDGLVAEVSDMSNSEKQDILLSACENYYNLHENWIDAVYDVTEDQIQKQIARFEDVIQPSYFREVESYLNQHYNVLYYNNLGQFTEFRFKNGDPADLVKIPPLLSCSQRNINFLQYYLYAQIPGYINENLSIDFCNLFSFASRVLDNLSYFYPIHDLLRDWGIAMIAGSRHGDLVNPDEFATYLPVPANS